MKHEPAAADVPRQGEKERQVVLPAEEDGVVGGRPREGVAVLEALPAAAPDPELRGPGEGDVVIG
jgi:hypothetical protein